MRDAYVAAIGRLFLALLFLGSGLSKLGAADSTIGYIASVGLPFAGLVYALTLAVEIGGGALLLIGFQVRAIAAMLGLFTLAAAVIFHSNFADQNQMIHFMKNLAIMGGLLQIAAVDAGKITLDARRVRKASA